MKMIRTYIIWLVVTLLVVGALWTLHATSRPAAEQGIVSLPATTTPTTELPADTSSPGNPPPPTSPAPAARTATSSTPVPSSLTVTLTIGTEYTNDSYPIVAGASVLNVLQTLATTDPNLELHTAEYEGLGSLITGMYGHTNGTADKYWQYEINGTMPPIGAGAFRLHGGEHITWKFAESTF